MKNKEAEEAKDQRRVRRGCGSGLLTWRGRGEGACVSNYMICPLPADGEEWVEIPCQGRPLVVAAYALNPYAFRELAIFRLSWGAEWWKEL